MSAETLLHLIRANVAGAEAVAVRSAAETVFEAGGKSVLAEGSRTAIRKLVEDSAKLLVSTFAPGALSSASGAGAAEIAAGAAPSAAREIVKGAGVTIAREAGVSAVKEVMKGAGKAAGIGFVVDGVFSGVEAAIAYKRRTMTRKEAALYVSKEAATGAISTGAGVALAAGVVALTGGLSAPVVFVIGAGAAIGAKRGLTRLIS